MNQSRGCNAVVTRLPGEAKSPFAVAARPELDSVSHRPQQLHRLPVGHRRRMFAQPPALAGRCLVHTTVGTTNRLGSGQ
jgi:hypothetical protein